MSTFSKAFISEALTNMSLAYANDLENFIADKIFPTVSVNKDKGQIYSYGREAMRIVETRRAERASYNSVEFEVTRSNQWVLQDHGLSGEVFQEDVDNQEAPIDAQRDISWELTHKLLMDKEQKALSVVGDTNLITNNEALSGTSQFDDLSGSNPFNVIRSAMDSVRTASGKLPNNVVMAYDVYSVLVNHPDVIARFPGASLITMDMLQGALASIFGIENLHIAKAMHLDANKGSSTTTLTDLFAKKIFLYYNEEPTLRSVSFGKTFARRPGLQVEVTPSTNSHEEQKRRFHSGIIVSQEYDQAIVAVDTGYLIDDVIS